MNENEIHYAIRGALEAHEVEVPSEDGSELGGLDNLAVAIQKALIDAGFDITKVRFDA